MFMEDKEQEQTEGDSISKENIESTLVQVVKEVEVTPKHKVQEPAESKVSKVQRPTHTRKAPSWDSNYIMEDNIAYCLLTKDREPSTLQEALNSSYTSLWAPFFPPSL